MHTHTKLAYKANYVNDEDQRGHARRQTQEVAQDARLSAPQLMCCVTDSLVRDPLTSSGYPMTVIP